MVADTPLEGVPSARLASAILLAGGDASLLTEGELALAQVESAAAKLPRNIYPVRLGNQLVFLRSPLPLTSGTQLVLQGELFGKTAGVRILARAKGGAGTLQTLSPGQVRLAAGEQLPPELRALLGGGKAPLAADILPHPRGGVVPVRIGSVRLNLQSEVPLLAGERVFLVSQDTGGSLALRGVARGGGEALAGPSGAAGRLEIAGFTPRMAGAPPPGGGSAAPLAPGDVLVGVLMETRAPGVPPPPSGLSTQSPQSGGAGAPGRDTATALLRFPGFDIEVPWPEGAARDFSLGDPVRVMVRGTAPRLDLTLLPPPEQEAGASIWRTPGGAGDRTFGVRLNALLELLGQEVQTLPPQTAASGRNLYEALSALFLREGEVTPELVQQIVARSGMLPEQGPPPGGGGEAPELSETLREGLARFLAAGREVGGGRLLPLLAGAEQSLASLEFLQAANGLRQVMEQGLFLQLPYTMGGESGTVDVIVRREKQGSGGKGGEDAERSSAIFLLNLEGLGELRIDAALAAGRVSIRFTTPSGEVGKFLETELPKLQEGIESYQIPVEGLSWILGRLEREPLVPREKSTEHDDGFSFIDLKV